eukprot:13133229-Alexandrium_andersonii.AAC.1
MAASGSWPVGSAPPGGGGATLAAAAGPAGLEELPGCTLPRGALRAARLRRSRRSFSSSEPRRVRMG